MHLERIFPVLIKMFIDLFRPEDFFNFHQVSTSGFLNLQKRYSLIHITALYISNGDIGGELLDAYSVKGNAMQGFFLDYFSQ